MDFNKYMTQALELAEEAARAGEVPVGCVVVDSNGEVIGRGRNAREEKRLCSAHAEMAAIEDACRRRGDWRLDDCTLFVTLEPCPMCAGAMINSRLGTLVYGAKEGAFGSCGSVLNLFEERFPNRTAIYGGVLGEECGRLLRDFFSELRRE